MIFFFYDNRKNMGTSIGFSPIAVQTDVPQSSSVVDYGQCTTDLIVQTLTFGDVSNQIAALSGATLTNSSLGIAKRLYDQLAFAVRPSVLQFVTVTSSDLGAAWGAHVAGLNLSTFLNGVKKDDVILLPITLTPNGYSPVKAYVSFTKG
jgi:hypothetical protein